MLCLFEEINLYNLVGFFFYNGIRNCLMIYKRINRYYLFLKICFFELVYMSVCVCVYEYVLIFLL